MSKCIVTGGLGFIGSHVVDLLINEGHEVYIVDNLSTGRIENRNRKAEFINIDIQDDISVAELPVANIVFHLAALARIQPSIEDPVSSHHVNLTGTLNILEYCRKHDAKIIFSSSSAIYEGYDLPTNEESPINPKNPYALQKWMCELYIRLYSDLYGLDYAILRYFNVYGERQILEGAYAAVVGILMKQKEQGKKLSITNDGEQRRDFTYVKDVANANLEAIFWTGEFNIGTGKNYSINDLARKIGGRKNYIGKRYGEVRETLANNRRAFEHGWSPTVDIMDWIEK